MLLIFFQKVPGQHSGDVLHVCSSDEVQGNYSTSVCVQTLGEYTTEKVKFPLVTEKNKMKRQTFLKLY